MRSVAKLVDAHRVASGVKTANPLVGASYPKGSGTQCRNALRVDQRQIPELG
ncbi:MAG: hypothetical protein KME32_00120 [Mojavia pulchra JT2-VF2]|uniref:Uncharacterized protein n=1 Tax=Mojavia pulchra JT2-VF2 TaxID=287848 RepID=A0A951UE25_9NOST|nr:hypothetical protein [Mojavia pulchra JT2-VF2]